MAKEQKGFSFAPLPANEKPITSAARKQVAKENVPKEKTTTEATQKETAAQNPEA